MVKTFKLQNFFNDEEIYLLHGKKVLLENL